MRVVVITVYEVESRFLNIPDGFGFSGFILALRVDVGIVVKHGRADTVCKQAFDNGGGTGGAAGVEQYLVLVVGRV